MKKKQVLALVRKTFEDHRDDPGIQVRELKKLLKQAQASGDIFYIGSVFYYIAASCNLLGDRDGQMTYALKALAIFETTSEFKFIADIYITLGAAYFDQENYQVALSYYDKAYTIIKKHRISGISRMAVLNNIATCYCVMEDYRSGIRYLDECMELTRKEQPDNVLALLVFSINLSDCYMNLRETEKAARILADAAEWAEKVTFKAYACEYYLRCAITDYEFGNKKTGNKNTDTALLMISKTTDVYTLYEDLAKLVRILLKKRERKRADKAVEYIIKYGQKNRNTIDQLLVCRTLGDYYKNTGEPEQALKYYSQLDELYEARTHELKRIQLNIHKSMKEADASIIKLNKIIKESEERANREPMTRLLNRAAMLRVGGEFIETAAKKKEKVGVIFIDIDFFKECNDTYGHARGDEIIKMVADACRREIAANVRFARYGGDEFLGVTCGLEDGSVTEIACRICDRIRKADIPNEKNPEGHRVTLSVGVVNVAITDKTDTIIQIVNYADKATYFSKKAGKNCIHLLDHKRTSEADDSQFVRIDF